MKIGISAVIFSVALLFGASRLHSNICASAMVFLALLANEGYYEDAKIVRFRRVMIDSVQKITHNHRIRRLIDAFRLCMPVLQLQPRRFFMA